ncbi:MAG: nickel pincer cofactor biosynthesis protein LarB [Vampirovibrionia bacterium]
MNHNKLKECLEAYKNNSLSLEETIHFIKEIPFKDIKFAKVDNHRLLRQGFSEAVYSPGKTATQISSILKELKEHNPIVLATRIKKKKAAKVLKDIPDAIYDKEARIVHYGEFPEIISQNYTLIVTAGTVDIPIAKEALITLKSNGIKTEYIYDCGVAGIHRLLSHKELIENASVIIVIAGMEGALASVIGGISKCPVIAVPTSKGYGANFKGTAALLSMLNACSSCVSTVNIDNGYGAGIIASLIIRQSKSY